MYFIHVLLCRNGIVKLAKESKEGEVDFQISFIRYEKKKMYLVKSESSSFILAHFSVEECNTVHQDIPDDAVEFPLKDKHYELEVCCAVTHVTVMVQKAYSLYTCDTQKDCVLFCAYPIRSCLSIDLSLFCN